MARINVALLAFNRGRVSPLALARGDLGSMGAVDRFALSSEVHTNWMPRILGSMMLRPGMEYIGSTRNNLEAHHLNFIYALSDQAVIELTNLGMRVRVNDTPISRPSVTTTMTNSAFGTDLTGWTDSDEAGATSAWVTGGYMGLTGTGTNAAIRTQQVTVSGGNINTEHGLRVVINRGVVRFKVGSTAGGEEYVTETNLREGEFSFAFTPTGNFHITVSATTQYQSLVDSISIESAGDMVITAPWAEADLRNVRYEQSGDVLFVACKDYKQYKIERRATRSWGISEYLAENGPFLNANLSTTTITPSALSGNITLTASKAIFKSTDVGGLYRLSSLGQRIEDTFSGANDFSESIRVTGVGDSRKFTIQISGTFSATLTLQRSIETEGNWEDVTTYTIPTTTTYSDGLDNQIIYYRIGIKTGNYTSGSASIVLAYSLGTSSGVVRITDFTSGTSVGGIVLDTLGTLTATSDWERGFWSPRQGWPSAVVIDEGRLWWAGRDYVFGSVSDDYENYDDSVEGDSGPIVRSIGAGPVAVINWLMALQRLIIGTETSEKVARSSSLDEPLTPTVFNLKTPSTRGSTNVEPVKVDTVGMFVRNTRIFEMSYDGGSLEHKTTDLTSFVPEIGGDGIVRMAVQRYPDTRLHCVKTDGTACVLIYDRNEDVKCWVDIETDGVIEDVVIQPGASTDAEDSVYYVIKRTINGSDVRYYEKWALESECYGGTQNKQADSFLAGTQSSSATITGLSHLEGEQVIVWADGVCYSPRLNGVQTTFTVTGGSITLGTAVTSYVVGLPYKAQFKSAKLCYAAQGGTALLQSKRVEKLGVIMRNTHNRSLRYGRNLTDMYEMPLIERGKSVSANEIWTQYDERPFEFEQEFDTDSRLCLEALAPMPCTLQAAVMTVSTNDRL
jgi:hypothetical protein